MSPRAYVKVIGLVPMIDFFTDAIEAARAIGKEGWWVATIVDYAGFLEFGTADNPARPHWRPTVQIIANKYNLTVEGEAIFSQALSAGGGMTKKIAEAFRAELRRQIRDRGLVDTGNYVGSIGIGRTKEEAMADSMSRLQDPSTAIQF